ncbi:hypothetical protein [Heyndrickxia sporothermodurans]|uniref:hypothetical protein n=1 Tax=Heyndrickxia sporothermodurans TaxID=46224 RepID=UPI000D33E6F9|nr:hypothetical protein [Heyndrickxia sporothermodurans]PTY92870.1 hypothetical protein B5V90_01985 [Heyndrickxia sporothermodurans]
MKIYPSFHNVRETDKVQPKDIPLSYISNDSVETEIVISKEPVASQGNKSSSAMPYEVFNSADTYLFNESGDRVEVATMMQRLGDEYYFVPQNAIEFSPTRFSFSVLVKKDMTFLNDKEYNIKVGCVDGVSKLSERLISIFGDAPRRGLSPLNVSINNQDVSSYSLIDTSFAENDMVFIESDDGVRIGNTSDRIDFESILDSHTNIWLSVKDFGGMIEDAESDEFELGSATVYNDTRYKIPGYNKRFNMELTNSDFVDYRYIELFRGDCPILLLEKANKGYILVAHESLFTDVAQNVKLIYELILGVFLSAYYRSPERNIWITDASVDYIALKESQYGLNHEKVTLDEMLYNTDYDMGKEYGLLEIWTSSNDVIFQGLTKEGVILFMKTGMSPDPKKEEDYVSTYTTKQTVMLYKKQSVNKVETDLSVTPIFTETGHYISVQPYRSTSLKIYSKEEQILRVPEDHTAYTLICKDSIFKLIPDGAYDPLVDGLKMATVRVIQNRVTKNYDMRVLGGGLPEDQDPNFNLLDIGHIDGRPYRIGSSMIITLPKRLEPYREIIEATVSRHVTSGDYPIILFE